MLRRPRKQRLVADINITPFTDVILVLLIIFMVTTPLISQSIIKVDLPKARNGRAEGGTRKDKVDITITSEGLIYLDGKPVVIKELRDALSAFFLNNPDLLVVMRADKSAEFREVVGVIDLITELGITRFNIAALKEG